LDSFLPGKTNPLPTHSPKAIHSRNFMLFTLFYSHQVSNNGCFSCCRILSDRYGPETTCPSSTSPPLDEIGPASRSANPSDSLERPHLCAAHTKQLIHAMEEDIGVHLWPAMEGILCWGQSLHIVHKVRSASLAKMTAALSPVF
jgi:hypothetical protein